MSKETLHKEWQARIAAYRTSGLSCKAWCEQNGENYHTLRNWITKYPKTTGTPVAADESVRWVTLQMNDTLPVPSGITVTIGPGTIRLESSFDHNTFLAVSSLLRSLC